MKEQNGFLTKEGYGILLGVVVIFSGLAFGLPQYGVWTKTLNGKAQLAEAEVIRAEGVAKANQIIGESLKDNPAYLQYLWITEGEKDSNRTVYMIPSNGGAPVPTFDIQK